MSLQKRIRVKLGYKLFGNSFATIINKPRFNFIKDKIPEDFKGRSICDLGCGDGSSTLRIKDFFEATEIVGYDIEKSLVNRAIKKGMEAEVMDLQKNIPKGEMATIWGVLHHIKNKGDVLRKVAGNFDYVVIREPIKSWWAFLDGGEPLELEEWIKLFDKVLGKYKMYRFKDDLYVFWKRVK